MDALLDTPLGRVLLKASDQGLTGLYFLDQRDAPVMADVDQDADSSAGRITDPRDGFLDGHGSLATLKVSWATPTVRSPCRIQLNQASPFILQPLNGHLAVSPFFQAASEQLGRYFQGQLRRFSVPLDLESCGTPFQVAIWKALVNIPYGQCVSYADLAGLAGYGTRHGRATGVAVGKNPVSILVPCHRIVSSSHRLTGYSGGLHRKLALLELEGVKAGA